MRLVISFHEKVPAPLLHPVITSWGIDRYSLLRDLEFASLVVLDSLHEQRHFHLRNALLMRESGLFAVLALVSLFFMPHMREQNDLRLDLRLPDGFDSVTGAASLLPGLARLYDALPLALSPPDLLLPALLCHAGDPITHKCCMQSPCLIQGQLL